MQRKEWRARLLLHPFVGATSDLQSHPDLEEVLFCSWDREEKADQRLCACHVEDKEQGYNYNYEMQKASAIPPCPIGAQQPNEPKSQAGSASISAVYPRLLRILMPHGKHACRHDHNVWTRSVYSFDPKYFHTFLQQ